MKDQAIRLEKLIEDAGFGWGLRLFSPQKDAAAFYSARLDQLDEFMASQGLGKSGPTVAIIESLCEHSPFRADAILEAIISIKSPQILCAAWRIIQGMTVQSLTVDYAHCKRFDLTVTLKSPYGDSEVYRSDDIDDLPFIRHLGKCKLGGQPLLNGFHALKRK